ncbi:hypothetical protein L1D54_06050 [Vibrio brasiliensis]|uniref:hypothetical protein n=1 Tax=Vibrio brasiliensis TaxID=170652 RepID=UPI001EFE1AE9|nr:hypothetical protein [Vibrio brasiliensis]MCG9750033.1 hypothetical protein [Vibrio brasiliensis]MCG9784717.1 hypothetical protein [Vibrio brasiliensis]
MGTSIFLSYPNAYTRSQLDFISMLSDYLIGRGYSPRTLGVTDYDMDAPLKSIRRLMSESNGLITVAFRRYYVVQGSSKPGASSEQDISRQWFTSPYSHIEPAMAFQLGLPVLILRESKVIADGLLDKGVLGTYMPEFNLDDSSDTYLNSREFNQLIKKWESQVERVVENRGNPPSLY